MAKRQEIERINGGESDPLDVFGGLPMDGSAMQRVQTQYMTAMRVQIQRALPEVEKRVLVESDLLGDSAYYAWGNGKDHIEGPTIKLANVIVRCWGNCAVNMQPVQETASSWIFSAEFIDLETGFTLTRQFRQSKRWTVHGRHDEERKDDIRFQIGQSKAARNVVLNAIPSWLIDKAIDRAKGGVREQLAASIEKHGAAAVQDRAIDKLERLGVPPERVIAAFGRKAKAALTLEDLVTLSGNIRALESGADTIESMFPIPEVDRGADAMADRIAGAVDAIAKSTKQEQPSPQMPDDAQAPVASSPADDPFSD